MREIDKVKWGHFLDIKGNKNNSVILNGGNFSKQLQDTYFEIEILKDGSLHIEVEEVRFFFYKNKLDTIYMGIENLIYKLAKKKEYAFYDEKTHQKSRIVQKNYSTIENINW